MKFSKLISEMRIVLLAQPKPCKFDVGLEPQPFVVCALERLKSLGIKLFHTPVGCFIIGRFLDKVEHIIDGFFRVITSYCRLDIGEKLLIMFHSLFVSFELVFEFDRLFQSLEAPKAGSSAS